VLDAAGYRVHAAGPANAIAMAEGLGAELDTLVTDVVMPDLDGPTIAAALTSRRRDLRVLFMSGYPRDRESQLTGAVAEGAVLAKPFTQAELCGAVRRVLDRQPHGEDRAGPAIGRPE
jgi:two-component system cell cycle sensor histidine kinase/response regulator CckA